MSIIENVTLDDLEKVTDCMVASFVSDPTARFSWPESGDYIKCFKGFAEIFFEGAVNCGTAYRINGYAGAIAWYPPGKTLDFEKMGKFVDQTCDPDNLPDLMAAMSKFDDYHPNDPHWYLAMIGVDPFFQGQGLGKQLIEHNYPKIDSDGTAVYLESSNPDNVRLYERVGFEALDALYLGGKPTMTPMIRPGVA